MSTRDASLASMKGTKKSTSEREAHTTFQKRAAPGSEGSEGSEGPGEGPYGLSRKWQMMATRMANENLGLSTNRTSPLHHTCETMKHSLLA